MAELLNKDNEKLWTDFTNNLEYIPPQHLITWMNSIRSSYKNCEPLCYLDTKDDSATSVFPFFLVKSKIFGNRMISEPFIDFGGPLGGFNQKFFEEIMRDIKEKFEKELKHIEIRLNNFIPNYEKIEEIFLKYGFRKEVKRHQFILKLEDEEILWNNFSRITRKGINKAKKSGLIIREIIDETELKFFYGLYLKSMKNFGTPQHSYNFFLNLMKDMKENFRGLNCYKEDRLIGSLITFYSKNYMYAAYNFSEHDSLIYQPNDLLYWEMIIWAIKNGIKYFDFGQCETSAQEGTHAAGIYKFKKKWNGKLYERPYFYYSFNKKEEENSEEREKFKKMINIWKMLPLILIKKIGPKIASELAL
ncbi:MAG TPA: GNAT family N-acetyltransferase [Candidatus Nanoarchaeia archaeon]|uniref:BioF2-like acetyltransferase domain-containing protein n=1 Tax=uncultured archaeon Rifle_16ft_4_minimus_37913 TaxID=1665152 RepID=A0A0H4T6B7_9ARCH|nr:hypothetical protein [uncultured archaeon Rifle_16ft_4_minimus_37913]HKZ33977.1 GNAT family N-acetyltransferase [Candidatus Nanoarchaeia archaeon]